MEGLKVPVHVEVRVKAESRLDPQDQELKYKLKSYMSKIPLLMDGPISLDDPELQRNVDLRICDLGNEEVSYWKAELVFHCYKLLEGEPQKDYLDGEEDLAVCEQWELPNRLLDKLWDTIICDEAIKHYLLGYASSAMIFTSASVDPDIISWNRMILLHGPPGTGKTTLCKALAQKVYIRNSALYQTGILLEINSHSLFSKWFSESGKLVMKLFDHISEIADDPHALVVVLIDEIESIASARKASSTSSEPGDAMRVVNAVLTSLDALKRRSNVLVLCTSNMRSCIDQAFLDRVDLQIHLGPPSTLARYKILQSCLSELMDKGVISPSQLILSDPSAREEEEQEQDMGEIPVVFNNLNEGLSSRSRSAESYLWDIATQCEGMSGRALRKLPLQAHAMYIQRPQVIPALVLFCLVFAPYSSISCPLWNTGAPRAVPDFAAIISLEQNSSCLDDGGVLAEERGGVLVRGDGLE